MILRSTIFSVFRQRSGANEGKVFERARWLVPAIPGDAFPDKIGDRPSFARGACFQALMRRFVDLNENPLHRLS